MGRPFQQQSVIAKEVAVVGSEYDHRVVGQPAFREARQHAPNGIGVRIACGQMYSCGS